MRLPRGIAISIQEMPTFLAYSISRLALKELIVSVNKIDFNALESLLLTKCYCFEFLIQRLDNVPSRKAEIPIFSGCTKIHIHLKGVDIDEDPRLGRVENKIPHVILKMNPKLAHGQYSFDLPSFIELDFNRTSELVYCSLHERNLICANHTLNSFSGIQELELNLDVVNELFILPNHSLMNNLKVLELNISEPLNISPAEIVNFLSSLKNLSALRLNIEFLPNLEIPLTVDLEETIFSDLKTFELKTNVFGLNFLELVQSKDEKMEIMLQTRILSQRYHLLQQKNITTLILESITCDDDWNALLSCPNLKVLTILQPLNFYLKQNTPNKTLRELSIKFFPEPLTNTVFDLPRLKKFKIEFIHSRSNEDLERIQLRICHFFCQNITNKMGRRLRKIEIVDNIGLDPLIFIPFRFKRLKQFFYDYDLMNLRVFDFYVQHFFKNTLSKRKMTIVVKSNATEAGFPWRISRRSIKE